MPNYLAVLEPSVFDALPDETVIGKDSFTKNGDTGNYFLNITPDEAEKVAFNLQKKFENKKTELDKVHNTLKAVEAEFKPYKDLGKPAEQIETELQRNQPEEVASLKEAHRLEKASLENSYKDSLTKAESKAGLYQEQLLKNAVNSNVSKARADFDLNDTADFVLRDFIKAEEGEDGNVVTRIYENGNPALVAGQPKTLEQLLNGWKEEKKFLSIFNAGTGGGTGGTNNQSRTNFGSKTIKRADWEQRSNAGEDFSSFFAEGGNIQD